ncbi:SDR family oxidoreductase [Thalassotalea euphylliae]|uniref:SDR family oxidoreductase n=1 Tax=Thalassotalea euphylliae TaxID=1655234 RepID=A0A3E0TN07_9GAMM|nr:SDR family NAD(P)-dependent oxidoreductase [Thalassotalea euphylliae]REL25640.1 SDR family oxidoreductase [Thalassotalea euphylliae]
MSTTTQYLSLKNKRVFITGGASGIGAAMVRAFVEQGAYVAFIDIDQTAGEQLVNKLHDFTAQLCFQVVDVTKHNELVEAISNATERLGGMDILINNVANDMRHRPQDVSPQDWQSCMQINLDAAFYASQAVFAPMRKQKSGVIINFSSINALIGPKNMVGYTTAKAGLIGMTKSLAKDYGRYNIRVNAILPGWIATDKQLASYLSEHQEKQWMAAMAIKKRIEPSEVAKLAMFLSSDDSAMITGQSITIDGGRT